MANCLLCACSTENAATEHALPQMTIMQSSQNRHLPPPTRPPQLPWLAFVVQAWFGAASYPWRGLVRYPCRGLALNAGRALVARAGVLVAMLAGASVCMAQLAVRGAPFCAEAIHGSQQWLADGNRVSQQNRSRTCRDSEGRVRHEFERGTRSWIFLRDPIAREAWQLDPERRVARRLPLQRPHHLALDREQRDSVEALLRYGIEQRGPGERADLGSRLAEGLLTLGERTTWTIEAGKMGNDRPMVITREVWRSPELSIPVSIQDRDPRFGERYLQLFNIRREEPDPELMRVPVDFVRQDPELRGKRLMPF